MAALGRPRLWELAGGPPRPERETSNAIALSVRGAKVRAVSHRLLPTSSGQRRGRGGHAISDAPRTPPKPPAGLTAAERAAWRELWSSPVAALWTSDDVPSVVRLIRLRARLDTEGVANAPVTLFGQVARLEDRLILTPQARRAAGVALVPSLPEGNGGDRNGSRMPSSRGRERLLRG
jgi:hypothetical protein